MLSWKQPCPKEAADLSLTETHARKRLILIITSDDGWAENEQVD